MDKLANIFSKQDLKGRKDIGNLEKADPRKRLITDQLDDADCEMSREQ